MLLPALRTCAWFLCLAVVVLSPVSVYAHKVMVFAYLEDETVHVEGYFADGKKAAVSIDKYLGGKGKLNKGNPIDIPDTFDEDEIVALKRFPLEMLSADMRKDSFDEVVMGYHKLNAMAEAMRCLHCDRR